MPHLPGVPVYVDGLREPVVGQPLSAYAILSPFILRTVDPPLDAAIGRQVGSVERLGKRIVFGFDGDVYMVIHLMIAGRFRWLEPGSRKKVPARIALARFEVPTGALILTEAGTKRRAALHVVAGPWGVPQVRPRALRGADPATGPFPRRLARRKHHRQRP